MTELNIGKIVGTHQQRDAIHVAVVPMLVGEGGLKPGTHVGLLSDGSIGASATPKLGIVDPFLPVDPKQGQRVWLFMYPGSITSLRHEWTHPAFLGGPEREESEKWLRAYAARMNCYDDSEVAYANLLEGLRSGELFAHGSDLHGLYDLDDPDDLRFHAERFLGIRIDWEQFSFSCSC
jgi:hypothetical protein